MGFTWITPVEVTPATQESWEDVDVSSHVPAGMTGVILHVYLSGTVSRDFGLRKNGSSDARIESRFYGSHFWAMMGIDANRIFECYIGSTANVFVFLVGYTDSDVTFFTNAYDKSLDSNIEWLDIDCSTECPNAIGIIIEVITPTGVYGVRKNGSSDSRLMSEVNIGYAIIGCDESQIVEGYISVLTTDFFIIGYVTAGATFFTDGYDKSLGSSGSYIDIDCSTEAPNAIGLFFEVITEGQRKLFALRKNGVTDDFYYDAAKRPFAFVECDESQIVEGKIEDLTVDFFLIGYASVGVIEKSVSDSAVGSELVTRPQREMLLTESAVGAEVISRPWRGMVLAEAGVGAEVIGKLRNVAPILDAGIGSEVISRPIREMLIQDLASAIDAVLKTRNLSITDTLVGVEVITVQGAVVIIVTTEVTLEGEKGEVDLMGESGQITLEGETGEVILA